MREVQLTKGAVAIEDFVLLQSLTFYSKALL